MEVGGLERLKDHYKYCIRLSASNKINPKNAFDLQLIDHMQDLVSIPEDGHMNFKVASSALDVGAKIYSNRVDCIQSEAQKVASSILMALDDPKGKNSDNPNDTQADGDTSATSDRLDDSSNADQDGQRKIKKKRSTKNIKTIAESTALDGKLEQMVIGDPFLDGLSRDYDMSCPAALICYNALTQPNCLLTVESDFARIDYRDKAQISTTCAMLDSSPVTLITKHINCAQVIRSNMGNKICPRLETFLFNDRTTSLAGLDLGDTIVASDDRPKPDATGAHEFDPEMYDGGNDHFADADSVMGSADDAGPNDENIIPDLEQIAATKPTEYGYSSEQHHRLMSTWAGPHAWKSVKTPQVAKGDAIKSTRKRTKLEQMPIDFNGEICPDKLTYNKKSIKHNTKVLRKWKRPLYPQDHNLTDETTRLSIYHTFTRPEETYHCPGKVPAEALKDVGKDHCYLGNNDDNDCPPSSPMAVGGFNDDHDDSDDEFRADPVLEGNEVAIYGSLPDEHEDLDFAGEDLIEQPYTVAQVNIPFAKAAKKMDVRRLKRVMWDLLFPPEKRLMMLSAEEEPADKQTSAMGADGDHASKTISPTPSESPVHLEFSGLYGGLPVKISPKMATDLSQSIAFVTLLHLANEKNLKLIQKQNLKDFIIEQDED